MPSDTPLPNRSEKPCNMIQTILIADDRYENRYLLQVLLAGNGYQVITAENGQEVLDKLKTGKIDAIISDILMPVMDGFQLCRVVKGDPELVHIPFIFYTASYTEKKDREFGLSLGADEYIIKPIEPEDFLAIIQKVFFEHLEEGKREEGGKTPLNNLSYYTSYAGVLVRKLNKKVVESDLHKIAARFSEEKYRVFLQNLQGIGYLIQTNEEIPLIIEGDVEEITGYTATEFRSGEIKWLDIIHPDDRIRYLHEQADCGSQSGNTLLHQYRIIHQNGEIRWVHDIASSLPGQDPNIILIQGAIYDVTLQKQAEEKIRTSEEHYRTLFETMAEGVTYQDRNGYVIDANPSAERILGLTLTEMQSRTSMDPRWEYIHEDGSSFPGEDHPAMVALRTGRKNSEIIGVLNPLDKRRHWILVHAVPQFVPGEELPDQVYTTFEDITHEKETRDHIEHLNRILRALRTVNFLITDETKRDNLLRRVCLSLVEGGGYQGIWIIAESGSGLQIFQETPDQSIRDSVFNRDINQGNINSWMNVGSIPGKQIITHSIQIHPSEENTNQKREGYGVMITRLSYEEREYGTICACVPDPYMYNEEEQSLFSEIARDVGFALNHIHLLHQEETVRNALRTSEKQYRDLVENVTDTIFTMNPDGVITYVSPSISGITGLSPSQYYGHYYLDFIFADDREGVGHWFKTVLLNHTSPVEFRIVNGQNQTQYLRVKATPVWKDDKIVEVTGILSDITAWKESERIKEERSKEVQTLLSLHQLTHETENEIFSFALQAALDITKSTIGFIAIIREREKEADFHIWSPEVMKTCSMQDSSPHTITSFSGLWNQCIVTKKPLIINDFLSEKGTHGLPGGHLPILRFLEIPILDGEQVTAIIAVGNRIEPYTDAQANTLNTLGNTLWEIIHRKRLDKEIKIALTQISQNIEQLATLNDAIRNPLTIIALISETFEEKDQKRIMEAIHDIDDMVNRLDQGWIQSEKVKNFLIKHYRFKEEDFYN